MHRISTVYSQKQPLYSYANRVTVLIGIRGRSGKKSKSFNLRRILPLADSLQQGIHSLYAFHLLFS